MNIANGELGRIKPEVTPLTDEGFNPCKIKHFKRFAETLAVVGGGYGDEGKGKFIDYKSDEWHKKGYRVLSARGQGSGNAGHTVIVNGVRKDFHYLTSAGLSADVMLLGPGMLIDPIRLLKESLQLPREKRSIIMVSERATIVTDLERAMDSWCENQLVESGQPAIGTTRSGVGPGSGNRGYRFHKTFADALEFKYANDFRNAYLKNPLLPDEVKDVFTHEYAKKLLAAIRMLNIVNSVDFIAQCREEGNWAVLLEVSQAVGLDPLFGHEGHNVTSTPCTDIGAAMGCGFTMQDFNEKPVIMVKAYTSKVGGGKHVTEMTSPEDQRIADFIDKMVGEHGVTTGRKRLIGWFDAVLARHAINLTGGVLNVNCMDVISALSKITDRVLICYAYRNMHTGQVTCDYPYHVSDYEPVYAHVNIKGKSEKQIIRDYIEAIEFYTGQRILSYGVGPSREDFRMRQEAFTD